MAGTLTVDTVKSGLSTPTVFQNTSGTEIGQLCRSWCAYSGSGSTIRGSFNISSVTKNAGGDYSPNFSTAMADANYSAVVAHGGGAFGSSVIMFSVLSNNAAQAPTTGGFRFYVSVWNNSYVGIDGNYQNIGVFR